MSLEKKAPDRFSITYEGGTPDEGWFIVENESVKALVVKTADFEGEIRFQRR